jgi:flagellar biogenesis protein FliO
MGRKHEGKAAGTTDLALVAAEGSNQVRAVSAMITQLVIIGVVIWLIVRAVRKRRRPGAGEVPAAAAVLGRDSVAVPAAAAAVPGRALLTTRAGSG